MSEQACAFGHFNAVALLLEAAPEALSVPDLSGDFPLHACACNAFPECEGPPVGSLIGTPAPITCESHAMLCGLKTTVRKICAREKSTKQVHPQP